MSKFIFSTAAIALAIAATPASAQLLGGATGGGLGGGLGSGLGGVTGSAGGTLGGMIERGPASTSSVLSGSASNRTDKSVNTRSGRVKASQSSSGGSALDNATQIGGRSLTSNGSASGSASGDADAQLVGTDAVRGAVGQTRDTARGLANRTRETASGVAERARSTAGNAVGDVTNGGTGVSGSGEGSGSGSGALSALGGSGNAAGNLALAGSAAAGNGGFPIDPGMAVTDAKGRAIGTVQSVRSAADGTVQRVLVRVKDRVADLPAANFSGSGNALVSAMGKGDVKDAAN